MKLTDADKLMPLFVEKAHKMPDKHGVKLGDNWLLDYNDIKDVLENAPTEAPCDECHNKMDSIRRAYDNAMAKPHGKWRKKDIHTLGFGYYYDYECSVCKSTYEGEYNFCPNCGADMREEADND